MFKKEQGFTLIELMVVVLIIAILVAIAIPVFSEARESAWRRSCQANLRTIDGAIQSYNASYDGIPSGFASATGVNLTNTHPLITGKFLKRAPECPKAKANGVDAIYKIVGDPNEPHNISARCPQNYHGHTY